MASLKFCPALSVDNAADVVLSNSKSGGNFILGMLSRIIEFMSKSTTIAKGVLCQ